MAGYLGASPVPQTIQKKQSFTATASQTTFTTTGYTDGQFINVYLNGVRLINGTDYTATNGSDIVLTTGASASDVLDFETFNEFTLVDQTLETPTFRTSATLKNDTHEDTDGGRESTLIFKGEQTGGEISTLAEIEASHDGTADDEKGDLIFRTNDGSDGTSPTEAMRIDSSQNVGIKTSSPVAPLHVDSDNSFGNILLSRDGGVSGRRPFGIGITGSADDDLTISASVDTDQAGAFDSDRVEIVRFLSGGGMTFNGDTAAANALDDYEEGTWTPVITPELGSAASITVNHASYTKIGRLVYVVFDLRIDSISGTSSSAAIELTGLPFTRDVSFGGGTNVNYSGLTASMTGTLALQGNSTTKYRIVNSMGTTSQNASDHLTSNSLLRAQFSYHAA